MKFKGFPIYLVLLMIIACSGEKQIFDFGEINDDTYQNEFFKFSLEIPKNWSGEAQGANEWKIKNNYFDPKTNEVEDIEADVRDVDDALLVVMLDTDPELGDIPSSITIFAESLYYNEEVKNGLDYLVYSTSEIIEMGNFTILSTEYDEVLIGNQTFYKMDAQLDVNDAKVLQSFISTKKNKFGLSAILTYSSEKQKRQMIDILKTIDFYG